VRKRNEKRKRKTEGERGRKGASQSEIESEIASERVMNRRRESD